MSKEKSSKALSIIGGLIGFAVVFGVLINRDEALKAEVQNQISSVLKATKKLVRKYEIYAEKASTTSYKRNMDDNSNNNTSSSEPAYDYAYDNAWKAVQSNLIGGPGTN